MSDGIYTLKGVSDGLAKLLGAGVTVQFGEDFLQDHSTAGPRVVCVPIGGPIEPGQASRTPAQLATRAPRMDLHLEADTLDGAELLLLSTINACKLLGYASALPISEKWPGSDGSVNPARTTVVLSVAFKLAVLATPMATVRATEVPATVTVDPPK